MNEPRPQDVTQALLDLTGGDDSAAARLMEVVYDELRALAGNCFRGQRAAHTLQPTALVHEAFVRISNRGSFEFKDRAHFFAVCATIMRRILADHARTRRAKKRGGDWGRVTLANVQAPSGGDEIDVLDLDDALTRLARHSRRQARIVEYRFFSGMSVEEVAGTIGVSVSTVEEGWRMARAWLSVQLTEAGEA